MSNENLELIVRPMNELKATANRECKMLAVDSVEAIRKPLHDHGSSLLDCFLDWIITKVIGSTT